MIAAVNKKLNAKIQKFRPTLSKASVRVYSSTIKRVAKLSKKNFSLDMKWLDNSVLAKCVAEKDTNRSKNYLNAILVASELSGNQKMTKKIREVLTTNRETLRSKRINQKMTVKEKERAIDWPTLVKRFKSWAKRLPPWTKANWRGLQRFVILSCYVAGGQAPLRLDWFNVSISKTEKNYVLWQSKELSLGDFKTAGKYGRVKIKINNVLFRILKKWRTLRENMGDNTGLLILTSTKRAFSRNSFGKMLSSIILEVYNKHASVADLRKSFITWRFKDAVPLRDRLALSKQMLHSPETAAVFYEKH